MDAELLYVVTVVGVGVALLGLLYGVTGHSERRRHAGLHILQFGMVVAGLAMIGGSFMSGRGEDALYGLLFIVFGTGVTEIGKPGPKRKK